MTPSVEEPSTRPGAQSRAMDVMLARLPVPELVDQSSHPVFQTASLGVKFAAVHPISVESLKSLENAGPLLPRRGHQVV